MVDSKISIVGHFISKQVISGPVKADVKIIRIVSGLNLPIVCYLNNGNYVGSCVYNDVCQSMKQLFFIIFGYRANECPQSLIDSAINCECPFYIPLSLIYIDEDLDIEDLATSSISWMGVGDFNVDIKASRANTSIICLNIKFSRKSKNL